ncbi:hypothetical protein M404DRAFT_21248 [Pisolithus tinctorius Marx 270]|uniref:Uncharacterized protein n=1 Tax=Pisolithus tinctorius Marx 270 TaxID=870435 RepID=A0A0C3PN70_PISTI|nr:hypothetical protein M404DRAFT_21248 [Pisolithus tinctorius Marx 270]
MRDQAITLLSAALRHVRVLINTAPQPEESFEAIYKWVEDWDQTWAGIYLWWKYIDENKISIPKVHNTNLCDMTEESVIWQNEVILAVIVIADLRQPEGQCRFNVDDLFEDYQEWVEERTQLEAKRLAKALSMHTRAKQHKATSEEDELVDNGEGEPGPSAKGPRRAGENEPCKTCAQANLVCIREPESSCKWCQKAKHKCSCSCGVGRKNSGTVGGAGPSHKQVKSITSSKQPDLTPTCSPLPELTPSPHNPSPAPHLFFHGATPMPGPSFKPSPFPVDNPQMPLLINKPQGKIEPFFATATSLLDEPGDVEVMAQSDTPSVSEFPEVKYPHEWLTANIVEHLQVLEVRAEDEEFKLEQVYQMLEMLARQVTHWIETVWARWEELRRLKDDLQEL